MNCKDCKFYKKGYFTHEGFIERPKWDYGNCLHEKISSDHVNSWLKREDTPSKVIDGLVATGYEERGELIVGELFGCIHFENKETNGT